MKVNQIWKIINIHKLVRKTYIYLTLKPFQKGGPLYFGEVGGLAYLQSSAFSLQPSVFSLDFDPPVVGV